MGLYPDNTIDFHDMFPSEDACIEYLIRLRWPNGFVCPYCNSAKAWEKSISTFRCASCGRDISVTSGTIFHRSHLSLRVWFQIIWDVVSQKHGVSALGLSHSLGFTSHKTITEALRKLRRAMVRPGRERLSGLVEADEIIVGGIRSGSPGRSHNTKVSALLKRWLLSTHQGSVRPANLQQYLNEFTFRFNRRRSRSRGLLFYRLLSIALIYRTSTS